MRDCMMALHQRFCKEPECREVRKQISEVELDLRQALDRAVKERLLIPNRVVPLRLGNLDHILKHKKPSMIHTVDQFIMEGGKMKKLHSGSKNQNVAFNMELVG